MVNQKLKERFLKYISFDTQSNDQSNTIPSTEIQKDLGKYLSEELKSIGVISSEDDGICSLKNMALAQSRYIFENTKVFKN